MLKGGGNPSEFKKTRLQNENVLLNLDSRQMPITLLAFSPNQASSNFVGITSPRISK